MSEKEYTPKNILSLIAVGAIMISGCALITACDSEIWYAEEDAEIPVFTPNVKEFQLTDGTRCVMFSTRHSHSQRAGSSGVSCDWYSAEYQ